MFTRHISASYHFYPEIFQPSGTEGSHFYEKYFSWLEQKEVILNRNISAVWNRR
jgi:hypothetical protein